MGRRAFLQNFDQITEVFEAKIGQLLKVEAQSSCALIQICNWFCHVNTLFSLNQCFEPFIIAVCKIYLAHTFHNTVFYVPIRFIIHFNLSYLFSIFHFRFVIKFDL